ncbi:hypothetical protein C4D60_Mb09t27210 [Musa balbisiana]|uniref:CTCHY-type domain-containing protein n=1 Tax=Musa balbisiana TaxID=52838 RepID=A0A4S8IK73_MUSBA|nr:hypothetical protein C4D60_Mb09t27210 [Musa balbisiana]
MEASAVADGDSRLQFGKMEFGYPSLLRLISCVSTIEGGARSEPPAATRSSIAATATTNPAAIGTSFAARMSRIICHSMRLMLFHRLGCTSVFEIWRKGSTIAMIAASADNYKLELVVERITSIARSVKYSSEQNYLIGSCYSTTLCDKHSCVENSMRHNCPICYEYLFESLKETRGLNCGHHHPYGIYSCQVCSKSVCDMSKYWRKLDEELQSLQQNKS